MDLNEVAKKYPCEDFSICKILEYYEKDVKQLEIELAEKNKVIKQLEKSKYIRELLVVEYGYLMYEKGLSLEMTKKRYKLLYRTKSKRRDKKV